MWQLTQNGQAHPLLPGHWPVPVQWNEQWWCVPGVADDVESAEDVMFVPAAAPAAARFDRLAVRVATAPSFLSPSPGSTAAGARSRSSNAPQ